MAGRELEQPQRMLARSPSYRSAWRIGGYGHGRAGPLLQGDDRVVQIYWLGLLAMWVGWMVKPSGMELLYWLGIFTMDLDGWLDGGSADTEGRSDRWPMTATRAGGGHQGQPGWSVQLFAVIHRRLIREFEELELVRA